MTTWEYKLVLAPAGCAFGPIGQTLDRLGTEGWELCSIIDKDVVVPSNEVPPDLRGEERGSNGAVLLDRVMARGVQAITAHHLIFKRPAVVAESNGES